VQEGCHSSKCLIPFKKSLERYYLSENFLLSPNPELGEIFQFRD